MKIADLHHYMQQMQGYKWYLGAYKLRYGNIIELHFVPCAVMQPVIDACCHRN